jgi:CelD/BcsL family acetyltransferase involved in cellulose biosynthesis
VQIGGRRRAASPASTSFTTSPRQKASGARWRPPRPPSRHISGSTSLNAWQRQVGEREGLVPFVVVAYDTERRPLLLLPLALRHAYGARCASFMGGKHSTFNMALFDRDFAASATQADLESLIAAIAQRSEADVLTLHQQPARWRDLPQSTCLDGASAFRQ